jgi:toxin ParE1/3/4
MRVVVTRAALSDLSAVRAYIGERNPAAASRVAVQILSACDRLEYFPKRGRPGATPGTREITSIRPFVIVYRIGDDVVEILRIWHGAQDR